MSRLFVGRPSSLRPRPQPRPQTPLLLRRAATGGVVFPAATLLKTPDNPPVGEPPLRPPTPTSGGASSSAEPSSDSDNSSDDGGDESGDSEGDSDAGAEPSTLAGMRVALTSEGRKLCVLGTCETPWGSVPISCSFGVDEDTGLAKAVLLHEPQTGAVLAALSQAERKLGVLAKEQTADVAVEDLVRRARLGDQNAMGMISEVKRCADRGAERAALMLRKIQAYIAAHPHTGSTIGAESGSALTVASTFAHPKTAITLANGPQLTKERLIAMAKSLAGSGKALFARAFFYGCTHFGNTQELQAASAENPEIEGALRTGMAAGLARAIQKVRLPDSSIMAFCPQAAWELGE